MEVAVSRLRMPHLVNLTTQRNLRENEVFARQRIDRLSGIVSGSVFDLDARESIFPYFEPEIMPQLYLSLNLLNTADKRSGNLVGLHNFCRWIIEGWPVTGISFTEALRTNPSISDHFLLELNKGFSITESQIIIDEPQWFLGHEIVERRISSEDERQMYNCMRFAFGGNLGIPWESDQEASTEIFGYRPVNGHEKGDLALYYLDGKKVHVGIVEDELHAISKYGHGHIFRHRIFDVPKFYGVPIFYRQKELTY